MQRLQHAVRAAAGWLREIASAGREKGEHKRGLTSKSTAERPGTFHSPKRSNNISFCTLVHATHPFLTHIY